MGREWNKKTHVEIICYEKIKGKRNKKEERESCPLAWEDKTTVLGV